MPAPRATNKNTVLVLLLSVGHVLEVNIANTWLQRGVPKSKGSNPTMLVAPNVMMEKRRPKSSTKNAHTTRKGSSEQETIKMSRKASEVKGGSSHVPLAKVADADV